MIIDTHCHYNLEPLFSSWQTHWKNAQNSSVAASIVVGTSLESSLQAIQLTEQNKAFCASVGIHPTHHQLQTSVEVSLDEFKAEIPLLERSASEKKVIAIGECGLDYFRFPDDDQKELRKTLQQEILRVHLQLAKRTNLPLIIHLRDIGEDAYWDFLKIYKAEGPFSKSFVLHCLSGPVEFVKECLELGAYTGIAANITYKNTDYLRQLVSSIPKNRVLVETDAPFLPPVQFRGQICEPRMIQWTAEYLTTECKISTQQLVDNSVALFPPLRDLVYAAI